MRELKTSTKVINSIEIFQNSSSEAIVVDKFMKTEVRIDKWLWAVRLFKTRTLASEACKKGKVIIHNIPVKPSRNVKIGDVVCIKFNPVLFSFKVLALSENRMNAKLVPDYMLNVTTPDQLELIELGKLSKLTGRERGTGRPTKKERRELDDFIEPIFIDENGEWNFDNVD